MIDLERLKNHFDHDSELFEESRDLLLKRLPIVLEELRTACRVGDSGGILSAAHSMRGMVSNFFAPELAARLQLAEEAGRHEQPLESQQVDELTDLVNQFEKQVQGVSI